MPFHLGVFGSGKIYLTPPATVPDGTRAYVYMLGEDEDPISFYRRLVLIEPEDARLYSQLGHAQLEAGKLADAEASLSRAVQLDFGFAEAHFALGRCYQIQRHWNSAANAYHKATDLAPDEVPYHRHYIQALIQLEDVDGVFAALESGLANAGAGGADRLREWVVAEPALEPLHDDPRWLKLIGAA